MYYVNEGSTYAIGILFPIICSAFVVLRFVSRRRMKTFYGIDDWMSVAALVFTVGCATISIYGDAKHTIGWHNPPPGQGGQTFTSTDETGILNAKLRFAFMPLSIVAIGLIRLTICLLYRRLFRGDAFHAVNWSTMGIIVCWMIAFIFACFFQCALHFSAFWNSQAVYAKYCPGSFNIYAGMALADVIIDIAILIIPIKPVFDLQMSRHRKFLVLLVFALGIFSIAAGMTRMILLMEILTYDFGSNDRLFGLRGITDPRGITGTIVWWSYMEIGVGCLVSNMPAVIGLFRGSDGKVFKSLVAQISRVSLRSRKKSGSTDGSSEHKLPRVMEERIRMSDLESLEEENCGPTDPRW